MTDEPRGIWFGDGAQQLGISGEVEDEAFQAVMAGMDPRRSDRDLGRHYDDRSARGFDVTASAPKSVSVLWALGDQHIRRAVLDAHDSTVRELAGWIEEHAHTRYRIGGEVAVVDAEGIDAPSIALPCITVDIPVIEGGGTTLPAVEPHRADRCAPQRLAVRPVPINRFDARRIHPRFHPRNSPT